MNREDTFYQAMLARDHRFDGKFFIGVKTTGIYCRPICPAKPKRENVEFFANHLEAEKSGYRPCLRCRPESAPLSPVWIGKTAVVRRAVKVLHNLETLEFNEEEFADSFGVSARHLRRLFVDELGKTPKQLSFENRLNLSRKLITETPLPITEVAFAAGFQSIRRFNDAFKDRFKKAPREIRRSRVEASSVLKISLPYRPPFDFEGLWNSYRLHKIGDLEHFADGKMYRVLHFDGKVGQVAIGNDAENACLRVEIDFPDNSHIHAIVSRVRALFDLDSDPVVVANALEDHNDFKKLLRAYPGIRLPSGWDAFEVAIAAILGQLVSLERARALVSDLIELAGTELDYTLAGKKVKLFPTARQILAADLSRLKTTGARRRTLKEFCQAIVDRRISLDPTQEVESFVKALESLYGIGPWTANYIALKAVRSPDSFPASDLVLARAVEMHGKDRIDKVSPWRGYLAALFWRSYSQALNKKEKK